ncbi:hypothetical protein [uncultured Legionella sp.]|uniref:hypothetical protein n=1 Tax=uncultured Legionella sp. TaxID=210934 RepID=UPI00263711BC|nr:hypothetical protein [uncultured Legionella sp.]
MPRLIFKFSVDNTDYINALTKHYSKFKLRLLDDIDPSYSYSEPETYFESSDEENILGESLSSFISQAKEDGTKEIIIELRGEKADCEILPQFKPNPNEKYQNTLAQSALEKAYFNLIAEEIYQMNVVDEPEFHPITQEEILNFFLTANLREDVDIKITSALNLPESETILFTDERGLFMYYCYGEYPKLKNVSGFYLNIEKGFRTNDNYFRADFLSELWSYFNKWEENKYQGSLFPPELSIDYNINQPIENNVLLSTNRNGLFQPISDEKKLSSNTSSLTYT